ncbi:MAG: peptidase M14, partial [Bacteroidetes bacterium]
MAYFTTAMHKEIARQLFDAYESFPLDAFTSRRFTSAQFHSIIDKLGLPASGWRIRVVGQSLEGRPIRLLSAGTGEVSILLWSQMHGDESTATMAIADIFNYFNLYESELQTRQLLSQVTIHFLPMLNPDGAELFQRRTAQGIDMNRDALALRTPEARILKSLQQELKPDFGFNLHDQELSTIGNSKILTQIALLAPAYNEAKEDNDVRTRAKHLNATFAEIMQMFIPGAIARYDDCFEPRAFGDNMQKWGTGTMLVESGHALNDP